MKTHRFCSLFIVLLTRLTPAEAFGFGFISWFFCFLGFLGWCEFDPEADPLLANFTSVGGANVSIVEPQPGVLVVYSVLAASNATNGTTDPIDEYHNMKGMEDKDVGEFYEIMSGQKPTNRMKEALYRHQKNKDNEEERTTWDGLPPVETITPAPLEIPGRRMWTTRGQWIDKACSFNTRIISCTCYTYRAGEYRNSFWASSWGAKMTIIYDLYNTIATASWGFTVSYEFCNQECSGWWFWRWCENLGCEWLSVGWRNPRRLDEVSTMWITAGGRWKYFVSVNGGSTVGWHFSEYALKAGVICYTDQGYGCYVCPNVDVV